MVLCCVIFIFVRSDEIRCTSRCSLNLNFFDMAVSDSVEKKSSLLWLGLVLTELIKQPQSSLDTVVVGFLWLFFSKIQQGPAHSGNQRHFFELSDGLHDRIKSSVRNETKVEEL